MREGKRREEGERKEGGDLDVLDALQEKEERKRREGREEGREEGGLNALDTLQEVLDVVHGDNSTWCSRYNDDGRSQAIV